MALLYGIHAVREALNRDLIERLVVARDTPNPRLAELVQQARAQGVEVRFEPRARLDQLTAGAAHQGVMALSAGRPLQTIDDLLAGAETEPLLIALDGVEDPGNVGAVIRSADGAGAGGVILTRRRSAPLSEVVWKASAGAAAHVPIARVTNLRRTLDDLRERGLRVVGADGGGDRLWHQADLTGPLVLVVGREGLGLHRLVREGCDERVRLPMLGRVESLNVSACAAVLLYEAVRQRGGRIPPAPRASKPE